jgi:peptidoglycan/xylan/chitin deacetylase (PgdA/CDA1 family)
LDNWLDPLRRALDDAPAPLPLFFRDDDAGWADDQLFALLDLFRRYAMPIDLAVIPLALTPRLADALLARRAEHKWALGLHQHGYAHLNHEIVGRKCEFGPSRGMSRQLEELAAGHDRLRALLGDNTDPIFTPPWNRCTEETAQALAIEGFETLSRIRGSAAIEVGQLRELDVAIDWHKRENGKRMPPTRLGSQLAQAAQQPTAVGIMLHHAVMDTSDLPLLGELFELLARHRNAVCVTMQEVQRVAHSHEISASSPGQRRERRTLE